MTELPELMTVKELQQYLHIGKDKAYELVKSKAFPCFKLRGRYYILKDEFVHWVLSIPNDVQKKRKYE